MIYSTSYLLGRVYDADRSPWKYETIKETYKDLQEHLNVPGVQLNLDEYYVSSHELKKYFVEINFSDKESELAFKLKFSNAYLEDLFSDLLVL